MYDWGDGLEGGEDRVPFVSHGSIAFAMVQGCVFCDGRSYSVESTVSVVQRSGDKTHKSFAKFCYEDSVRDPQTL